VVEQFFRPPQWNPAMEKSRENCKFAHQTSPFCTYVAPFSVFADLPTPTWELRRYALLAYLSFSPVFTFFFIRVVCGLSRSFLVFHSSMQRSLEHESPQFAVHATFDSFAALKHARTCAALLDVFEFIPVKVDCERYTIKCKDPECRWYAIH
jgi:hypothetical protein